MRRPPTVPGYVRTNTCIDGHERRESGFHKDEEAVQEENRHLRTSVQALRRENRDVRERLQQAEHENVRRDQTLVELLSKVRLGVGVPGEALDAVRDDLQAMLHFKRRAQDARELLDEREQKFLAIHQELRVTRLSEMEDDVRRAKQEAQTKAKEWASVCETALADSPLFTIGETSRLAGSLVQKTQQAENAVMECSVRLGALRAERDRMKQALQQAEQEIDLLRMQRAEIEIQMDANQIGPDIADDIQAERAAVQAEHDAQLEKLIKFQEQEKAKQSTRPCESAQIPAAWDIDERLLSPTFRPLLTTASPGTKRLVWRLTQVLGRWQSGIDLLLAHDADKDGRVTVQELADALQKVPVSGCDLKSVKILVAALSPGLAPVNGTIAVVDFVLGIQMCEPPVAPSEEDFLAGADSLGWACRRRGLSEADLRGRLVTSLDPRRELEDEIRRLCSEVGLQGAAVTSLVSGFERYRELSATRLPSWRSQSPEAEATMLALFLRDLAQGEEVLGCIPDSLLGLAAFVDAVAPLGWAREEVETVAFLMERSPPSAWAGQSPVVDGLQLKRAVQQGGLQTQFPELAKLCSATALSAFDAAVAHRPQRSLLDPSPVSPSRSCAPQAVTQAVVAAAGATATPRERSLGARTSARGHVDGAATLTPSGSEPQCSRLTTPAKVSEETSHPDSSRKEATASSLSRRSPSSSSSRRSSRDSSNSSRSASRSSKSSPERTQRASHKVGGAQEDSEGSYEEDDWPDESGEDED